MPIGAARRVWYGWWVLAATTALITLQSGAYVFGFGAFFVPIVSEFGWGRAAASGAVSLARLENGILGPFQGFLLDRYGARRVMLVGIPLFATGFVLLSQVESLVGYYAVYILCLSVGSSLGFFEPSSVAVTHWFVRRRGAALGLMSSGIGFGTVLVPVMAWAIATLGWRSAAIATGIVVCAVGLPLAAVVRSRPEPYGEYPDGVVPAASGTGGVRVEPERPIAARAAVRSLTFWLLALSFAVRLLVTGAVSLHLIPLMNDLGLEPAVAGIMTTVLGVLSIVGRLGFGWLGDRVGQKPAYGFGLVCLMVSFIVLAQSTGLIGIVAFMVLYAPAYGGLAAQMLALRAHYFGRHSFATIGGLMAPIMTLGTITGPVFAGWSYDATGSYRLALDAFAAMMLVALLLLWRLPPRMPTRS